MKETRATSSLIIKYNNIKDGSRHKPGIRCHGTNVYVADNIVSRCPTGINACDGIAVIEGNLAFKNDHGITIGVLELYHQLFEITQLPIT